jgi:type VI secretion system protein ImpJ
MKFLSRVVWSEGMYLAPHHFQAQSRDFEDSIAFVSNSLWRDPWGILDLELDRKAIENGTASVVQAAGIFADGLSFDMPVSDSAPSSRNIAPLFPSTAADLLLYLASPLRKNDGFDSDLTEESARPRYSRMLRTFRDETNGIDAREVEVAHKNIRIVVESELTPEMTALPLARVVRDSQGHLAYDEEFIPCCLRISASNTLMLMVMRILEVVGEKSATIRRGASRAQRFEPGISALDVANYWFLHALHSAMPPLRHLVHTRHAHPGDCFVELSRLAGALCTFAVDSDPRTLPDYDHRNPGPAFQALCDHIKRHLEIVVPSNTVTLDFTLNEPYIHQAAVADDRCLRRARWILGVRSSIGESEQPKLVPQLVKVCSARFVPELVKRALPGMPLTHLPVPPAALRAEPDMQYFAIDTAGPCWEHILHTKTVGIYIPGDIGHAEFQLTVIVESSL